MAAECLAAKRAAQQQSGARIHPRRRYSKRPHRGCSDDYRVAGSLHRASPRSAVGLTPLASDKKRPPAAVPWEPVRALRGKKMHSEDMSSRCDAEATGWRDHIKVHRDAKLFEKISDAERQRLGLDIKEPGIRNKITLYYARKETAYDIVGP